MVTISTDRAIRRNLRNWKHRLQGTAVVSGYRTSERKQRPEGKDGMIKEREEKSGAAQKEEWRTNEKIKGTEEKGRRGEKTRQKQNKKKKRDMPGEKAAQN